jgi:hypothetical protein
VNPRHRRLARHRRKRAALWRAVYVEARRRIALALMATVPRGMPRTLITCTVHLKPSEALR